MGAKVSGAIGNRCERVPEGASRVASLSGLGPRPGLLRGPRLEGRLCLVGPLVLTNIVDTPRSHASGRQGGYANLVGQLVGSRSEMTRPQGRLRRSELAQAFHDEGLPPALHGTSNAPRGEPVPGQDLPAGGAERADSRESSLPATREEDAYRASLAGLTIAELRSCPLPGTLPASPGSRAQAVSICGKRHRRLSGIEVAPTNFGRRSDPCLWAAGALYCLTDG